MKNRVQISFSSWLVFLICMPEFLTSSTFLFPAKSSVAINPDVYVSYKSETTSSTSLIEVGSVNCPVWGYCDETPILNFNFADIGEGNGNFLLHVQIDEKHYEFDSSPGQITLSKTDDYGADVEYWAESTSTGSIFSKDNFRMRYVEEDGRNLLQLLGDQWENEAPGSALVWGIFPPMSEFETGWAQRIEDPDDLYTSIEYTLLAGRLIWDGIVLAKDCPNNGLLDNGAANTCGMEAARDKVIEWQNKNNSEIQAAGLQSFIPARLLKGMIGQESQFYPKWGLENEYGLGMLTEHGVDMLLQWNEPYYMSKCRMIYSTNYCSYGYLSLTDDQKNLLIGYVLKDIGTEDEYQLLAETLFASCVQTGYIVSYYTERDLGEVADYETLWRIALGIYHAGYGCMATAVALAWNDDEGTLSWEAITNYLDGDCSNAVDYFDKVINYGE